ncbi:K Homology domain-containing protein [Entamoeba marina]
MATRAAFVTVKTVFPGDIVPGDKKSRYGDGIVDMNGVATPKTNYYYVFSDIKKYHPSIGDVVIGKIVKRIKEKYLVDIGAYCKAELDSLAFENATKKSKPNLNENDIVYCRVIQVIDQLEVVCMSQRNQEDGFGKLDNGWTFSLQQSMCRRIMSDGCSALSSVGQYTAYEIAVGVNGVVWVRSQNEFYDVVIESCITHCIGTSDKVIPGVVKLVWDSWMRANH